MPAGISSRVSIWPVAGSIPANYDFGVSFTAKDREAGRATYNYGLTRIQPSADMFGLCSRTTMRAASSRATRPYHRGTEQLMGAFNWLDLTPKGRNETGGTMSWVRLHDEY